MEGGIGWKRGEEVDSWVSACVRGKDEFKGGQRPGRGHPPGFPIAPSHKARHENPTANAADTTPANTPMSHG